MPQIAVKISEPIFAKLKRLAHQGQTNYATIVEAALSAYEPGASEHASHGASEIHLLIESALAPVLERLEMLESLGLVKHPHPSSITVEIAQNAPESALYAQPIAEPQCDAESPKIAVSAAVDVIGREAAEASSSILSENEPHQGKKSVKEVIADLVQSGMRSQAAIAQALNQAGYRTQKGTEFERSNPQIKAALDAVMGK